MAVIQEVSHRDVAKKVWEMILMSGEASLVIHPELQQPWDELDHYAQERIAQMIFYVMGAYDELLETELPPS